MPKSAQTQVIIQSVLSNTTATRALRARATQPTSANAKLWEIALLLYLFIVIIFRQRVWTFAALNNKILREVEVFFPVFGST